MCSINHELKLIFIHTPKCGGLYIQQILEKFYNFKTYYFTHESHDDFISKEINNDYKDNFLKHQGFLNINKGGVLRYYMSSKEHNLKTKMDEVKWNEYKKFAVIRNPYDRFLSGVKFIKKQDDNKNINLQRHHIGDEMYNLSETDITNIRNVSKNYIENINNMKNYNYFHIFINQYDHLIDLNCELKIDYLIKFENLNSDLCDILLKSGIDKIKHRKLLLDNAKINENINSNFFYIYDESLLQSVNKLFYKDFENFGFNKATTLEDLFFESKIYYKDIDDFITTNIQLLIDLDKKKTIITHEELNNLQNENNKVCNDKDTNDKNIINQNILLENGMTINLAQTNDDKINFKNRNNLKKPINLTYEQHLLNIGNALKNFKFEKTIKPKNNNILKTKLKK